MTRLVTASKLWRFRGLDAPPQPPTPPIEVSLQGFSSERPEGGGGGAGKVKVWKGATAEAFVARLLTLCNVAQPGGL